MYVPLESVLGFGMYSFNRVGVVGGGGIVDIAAVLNVKL